MAKTRRGSVENMFAKKGNVQPQRKDPVIESPKEAAEPVAVNEPSLQEEIQPEQIQTIDKKPKASERKQPQKTSEHPRTSTNMDELFKKKKGRGAQKTVYFNKEVNDFCEGLCKKYNLGISDVVNRLIESIMEDELNAQ